MTFTLRQGSVVLAEISEVRTDMPWFAGTFRRQAAFGQVQHLFEQEEVLMAEEKWDEWEMLWQQIRAAGIRLVPSDSSGEISEFAIHIDGDRCRFRY